MATLHLKHITCYATSEWPQDEIYLTVEGQPIWYQEAVGIGSGYQINQLINITNGLDMISLYESDPPPLSSTHLGSHIVSDLQAGLGEQTFSFTQAGAIYNLAYEVF